MLDRKLWGSNKALEERTESLQKQAAEIQKVRLALRVFEDRCKTVIQVNSSLTEENEALDDKVKQLFEENETIKE